MCDMAVNVYKDDVVRYSMTKLCLSADYYSTISPAVSKFHVKELDTLFEITGASKLKEKDVCTYCGQIFRPGNHVKKLQPKMKLTKKIRQLQNKAKSTTKTLGKFQENLLKSYREGCNYIVITCKSCHKVSKSKVYSRLDRKIDSTKIIIEPTVLSKKQKKKLKKKLKGKSKKCPNAGLLIPGTSNQEAVKDIPVTSTPIIPDVQPTLKSTSTTKYQSSQSAGHGYSSPDTPSTSMKDIIKQDNFKKSKKKSSFTKLQQMLAKEQQERKTSSGGNSLAHFLGGL